MQYESRNLLSGRKIQRKISVLDIGIRENSQVSRKELRRRYPGLLKKDPAGNKGTFEKVLIIAGSKNMSGASHFAGLAAACAREQGMVRLLTEESNRGGSQAGSHGNLDECRMRLSKN